MDEDDAWDFLSGAMRTYDRHTLDSWKSEMTTLLIFVRFEFHLLDGAR